MINEQGASSVGKKVKNFIGKDDKEVFPAELANKVRALDKKFLTVLHIIVKKRLMKIQYFIVINLSVKTPKPVKEY